jgi:hypothetical protein
MLRGLWLVQHHPVATAVDDEHGVMECQRQQSKLGLRKRRPANDNDDNDDNNNNNNNNNRDRVNNVE